VVNVLAAIRRKSEGTPCGRLATLLTWYVTVVEVTGGLTLELVRRSLAPMTAGSCKWNRQEWVRAGVAGWGAHVRTLVDGQHLWVSLPPSLNAPG